MPLDSSDPRKRASTRRAVRKHIRKYGHPRDQRERGRDLLDQAEGQDTYEKVSWLKAQREALRLSKEMELLISRTFVAQKLAEVGRVIHDALDQIPDRVAHDLANQGADQIRRRLREEISGSLSALANTLEFGQELVDGKREIRKGNRGVKRARPGEIPSPP